MENKRVGDNRLASLGGDQHSSDLRSNSVIPLLLNQLGLAGCWFSGKALIGPRTEIFEFSLIASLFLKML